MENDEAFTNTTHEPIEGGARAARRMKLTEDKGDDNRGERATDELKLHEK